MATCGVDRRAKLRKYPHGKPFLQSVQDRGANAVIGGDANHVDGVNALSAQIVRE